MPFSKYSRRALKSFGLISLLFACAFATGKVNLAWYEELGGSMAIRDDATAMALDSAGNVLVTGWLWHDGFQRYNFSTAKYDPDGNLLWETRYNGTGSSNDIGVDVATDSANNVYVTGFSRGPNGKYDYATVKYDSSGVEQWATRYNGPSNNADSPTSMKVDGSGNVYVTGWSEDASMTRDIVTIKYSTNGNQLWARRYAGINAGYVEARSLAIDGSGNVFVKGNLAYLSAYVDGVVVLDISDPTTTPVLVGQYDTYEGLLTGFAGAWGVYPFQPSGNIYVSDLSTGLHILSFDPDYGDVVGHVTDASTLLPIEGVDVVVASEFKQVMTLSDGRYRLAMVTAGVGNYTEGPVLRRDARHEIPRAAKLERPRRLLVLEFEVYGDTG